MVVADLDKWLAERLAAQLHRARFGQATGRVEFNEQGDARIVADAFECGACVIRKGRRAGIEQRQRLFNGRRQQDRRGRVVVALGPPEVPALFLWADAVDSRVGRHGQVSHQITRQRVHAIDRTITRMPVVLRLAGRAGKPARAFLHQSAREPIIYLRLKRRVTRREELRPVIVTSAPACVVVGLARCHPPADATAFVQDHDVEALFLQNACGSQARHSRARDETIDIEMSHGSAQRTSQSPWQKGDSIPTRTCEETTSDPTLSEHPAD